MSSAARTGPFYDTYEYWLMPHGLRGLMTTVFWSPTAGAPSASSSPGRVRPFLVLAPGKSAREGVVGEHAFWRGPLWGRIVALQGDSSFTKFDLFEVAGSELRYWGTFRGNGYYDSEESHSFATPFVWMDQRMAVGDFKQQKITDSVFDPRLRRAAEHRGPDPARRDRRPPRRLARPRQRHPLLGCPRSCTTGAATPTPPRGRSTISAAGWGRSASRRSTSGAERRPLPVRAVLRALHARPTSRRCPGSTRSRTPTYVRNGFFEDFKAAPARGARGNATCAAGPGPRTR